MYANTIKINTSNMSEVEGDTIQDALDYLYGKAQNNSTKCPEGFNCLYDFKVGNYLQIIPSIGEFELTSAYTGSSTKQTIKPSIKCHETCCYIRN